MVWYVFIVNVSSNVLADCVAGLGFLVSIYYGFTGFACTRFYRHELQEVGAQLLQAGRAPGVRRRSS